MTKKHNSNGERERERELTHLELTHVSTDGTGVPEGRSGAEPRRNASK